MHCRRCKKKVSQYAKMCPYCHAQIQENERATRQYMEMLIENKVTHKNEGSKLGKRVGITLFSAFFAVYLLLISYKDRVNQWQITDQTVFYLKKDGLVAKDLKTGERRRVAELSKDKVEEPAVAAVEGEVFYHNESRGKIYYAKNIMVGENSNDYSIVEKDVYNWSMSPNTIADHVRVHLWDDSGTLYFAKKESESLYCFDRNGITQIPVPLVKEIHVVAGTNKLFIIAYEVRNDSNRYDYSTYDKTDSVVFYLVDGKTKRAEKLLHNRVDGYAYTNDCGYLYYQVENELHEFDLRQKKEQLFEKNVYQFLMVDTEGKNKLYYITYDLKTSTLYDYAEDPFKKVDEKMKDCKALLKKEDKTLRDERLSREQFRKVLKDEKVYVFEGTLCQYIDGKRQQIEKGVSMLDSLYCCMVDHEPYVYKSKDFKLGKYQLKKEGMEDINSVYDMVVNMIDGEMRNYDVAYETLYEYRKDKNIKEKREALVCAASVQYKIKNGALSKYDSDTSEEEDMKGSYLASGGKKYYISWYDDYTLYSEEKEKNVEIATYVEGYQILKDGKILTLCYDDKKGKDILYCIDSNLNREKIEEEVYGVLGKNTVSSKRLE